MTTSSSNSRLINDSARCQHRTSTGKRCRLRVVDSRSGLCFRHASQASSRLDEANLRSALADDVTEFQSAHDINEFLSRLLLMLSENRVSPRRAAVLAYVCNLLLRTLPLMAHETEDPGDGFTHMDVSLPGVDFGDLPRPKRDIIPAPGPLVPAQS